jgi:hypothetical protein
MRNPRRHRQNVTADTASVDGVAGTELAETSSLMIMQ